MPPHLLFFLSTLSFLFGIVSAGMGLPLLFALVPAAALFAILFSFGTSARIALLASLLVLAGSFYYAVDDARYRAQVSRVPSSGTIEGVVASDPHRAEGVQSFYLKTDYGKLLIESGLLPRYAYGDSVTVSGKIETPPQNSYGRYLAKERIAGIMREPVIERMGEGGGNRFLAFFISLRHGVRASFSRFLSPGQAAFLSGIVLGVNEDIAKPFLQNLSLSGTRHLTAVSGLHMSVVFFLVLGACAYFLPRRYAFLLTLVFVAAFTTLTGFTVSAVRAAIMAFAVGVAKETGRRYASENALAFAALLLALVNPKIPVFDVGFQLSFLAVISILYFLPVLRRLFRMGESEGFGGWKQSLLVTLSAQLATAPILITQFQNFSITAFAANILVIWVVPYLITLGFFLALFSAFLAPLAAAVSFLLSPLIEYVVVVINVFGRIAVTFNPQMGFAWIAVYYGAMVFLAYRYGANKAKEKSAVGETLHP